MMIRRALALAAVLTAGGMVLAESAMADPPCGRGWRRGEYCGPHHRDRRDLERRDWDRRESWRREPSRRDRVYGGPPVIVQPGPTVQLNIR